MIIREYMPSDCESMARLFYDTVHTINAEHYTKEQLDVWATGNVDMKAWNYSFLEHDTLIAEIDGVIVGFSDMDKNGYLDRLYVHKDYQHIGIAVALTNELEQRAKKWVYSVLKPMRQLPPDHFLRNKGILLSQKIRLCVMALSL